LKTAGERPTKCVHRGVTAIARSVERTTAEPMRGDTLGRLVLDFTRDVPASDNTRFFA